MQPQLLTVVQEETLKGWSPEEWKKWWIEPKYDGARLIYHKGQFLSRTGKPLHNLDHIAAELKDLKGWTLDGEVYGASWAETMSAARASKTVKANNGLKFAVFDCMEDLDWHTSSNFDTCADRRLMVSRLVCRMENVHVVPHVSGLDYQSFEGIHRMNLREGCDGTVLKLHQSLYEFKRTKTWLKVKPCLDVDAVVVDMVEGNGKYAGTLGTLLVQMPGETLKRPISGMTDAQRTSWWTYPEVILGETVEVKIRGVHPSGAWIEPRFERIREDK